MEESPSTTPLSRRWCTVVQAHGATAASNLTEWASGSDVVITMLPDGHIVRKVVLGRKPVMIASSAEWRAARVIIDMSSSAPVGTRKLGEDLRAHGIALIDAPVSGGVRGAVAGTLAIMIGGDKSVADRLTSSWRRWANAST